jgi:hypothetical protein
MAHGSHPCAVAAGILLAGHQILIEALGGQTRLPTLLQCFPPRLTLAPAARQNAGGHFEVAHGGGEASIQGHVGVAVHRREQQHGDGEKEPEPRQAAALASSVWLVEHVSRSAFEPFQKKLKSF